MSLIKKENLVVIVDTYESNGQQKNVYKTIGELVTMQGTDGPYQFFKLWGPHGITQGKVFEPKDNNQGQQPPQQGGYQQPPQQGGYQQPPQQGGYQQPPQQGYANPNAQANMPSQQGHEGFQNQGGNYGI
jgi:hypothetical protein